MRQKLSLKNENRGASLLVVLIILVVISAIAVIITKITITNIQMKEVERGSKKNFYSAEEVMDDLHTGAAGLSTDAMKTAYEAVMQNYVAKQKAGVNLQDEFKKLYMRALELKFWDSTSDIRYKRTDGNTEVQNKPDGDGKDSLTIVPAKDAVYSTSMYSLDTLKSCISDASVQSCVKTSTTDAIYDADYKDGTFTLKNVKVTFKDSSDYETTITADLVFSTPDMNLTGGDQIKSFMKYSLIADQSIQVGVENVDVGGNVYAGVGGITTKSTGAANFHGKVVLTRGNITAENDSKLTLGQGKTSVWAENIVAQGAPRGSNPYTIDINGNCYVADDLSLDKAESRVRVSGDYYGYNFQEDYGTQNLSKDAKFSSAMMVNGRDSKLDLSNIHYLMLAGRTFISRGNDLNNDVLLGESLSARSNQLAYYVPTEYVDISTNMLITSKIASYESEIGVGNITDYLATQQVVPYYVVNATNTAVKFTYYYLNFKNEDKANAFFNEYWKNNGEDGTSINKYLTDDAIVLDTSRVFTLGGDVLYRSSANAQIQSKVPNVTIDAATWKPDGAYFKICSNLAVKYKALQLGLTETNSLAKTDDVRFRDTSGKIDKTVNPLFLALIDKDALVNDLTTEGVSVKEVAKNYLSGGPNYQAVILTNQSTYVIPSACTQGIIVATGDVKVDHDFTGLIISNGTISFSSGAKVDADESMIIDMFAADLKKDNPEFSKYFNDYKSGGVITGVLNGKIDANNYLSYEKWKKNS